MSVWHVDGAPPKTDMTPPSPQPSRFRLHSTLRLPLGGSAAKPESRGGRSRRHHSCLATGDVDVHITCTSRRRLHHAPVASNSLPHSFHLPFKLAGTTHTVSGTHPAAAAGCGRARQATATSNSPETSPDGAPFNHPVPRRRVINSALDGLPRPAVRPRVRP